MRYKRYTTTKMADELSKVSGLSKTDSRIVLRHVINIIKKRVFSGDIIFTGFGTFSIKRCASKSTVSNVFTDHYYKFSFIPSRSFRDKVKNKARELSLKE